jgi:Leucine-rich repeat (LRR) protein
MLLLCFALLQLTLGQDQLSPLIFSDCKHLILPPRCQCYHSGDESQLRCQNIQLDFLPKLPNNMRWFALDFSSNNLSSIDSYVFSDIYVEKLNLRANQLRSIDLTAFDQIQNLKQLLLDHNQLDEFDPTVLTYPGVSLGNCSSRLTSSFISSFAEIFDVSHNPFHYLDLGEIFLHLPVLKHFYAVSCHLTNTSLSTLLKLTEHHHQYVQLLDLSWNNFTSLCDEFFSGFSNLHELRLEHNNIFVLDNYFLRSLSHLKILNLAFNSIEVLPNLFSPSLESFNLSSNHLQSLDEYFAANLQSIRSIDFDANRNLQSIASRAFCFINLSTLEKLSFRFNDLPELNFFEELLCRLTERNDTQPLIDLNYNINLRCNCMLVQFENSLLNYRELTCIQQGQDRYFISRLAQSFSNCSSNTCSRQSNIELCDRVESERVRSNGTCQAQKSKELPRVVETNATEMNITTLIKKKIQLKSQANRSNRLACLFCSSFLFFIWN